MEAQGLGRLIAGKYRIDAVIGRGGMGNVYAATNVTIGRRVALKLLTPQLSDDEHIAKRFTLEAQASAVISHPGIIDVLDMGQTAEGAPFIVMELLEGATLKAVQKKVGAFTLPQIIAVGVPLLEALGAAHAAHVVHRDVKPANIFLCVKPRRQLKVLDFGISRFGSGSGMTATGASMGTPAFMAPEQVRGEKNVGPGADLYAVGAILYQLASGRAPYEADSDIATLARVLSTEHEPLLKISPRVSPALAQLVEQLLLKDPAQRPADALGVARALSEMGPRDDVALYQAATALQKPAITASGGFPATPSSPALARPLVTSPELDIEFEDPAALEPTVGPPRQKSRAPAVLVGLFLVAGGLAAGWWAMARPEPLPPAPAPVVKVPQALPEVAPPPALLELVLDAEPASARIAVGGESPCNPCSLRRAPGTKVTALASAEGYAPSTLELTVERAERRHLVLAPIAAAPVKADPKLPAKKPEKKANGLKLDEDNPYH